MSAMSWPLRTSAHGSLTVGYRLAEPRRHPTFATDKPTHQALSVITIAPCTSIRRRKCLRLRLVARHGRRLRKRIRQSPLQSGIGLLRRTDTRLAFHCVCPMLSQACSATPVPGQWHTLCRQSACSPFPFPASPMLCRWRVKGCRWREPTRSPPLCSSHAKRFTAL